MPVLFIFMRFLPDYLFFSVSFSNAGMEIAFLLSCTNPCSCKSFSTFVHIDSCLINQTRQIFHFDFKNFFPFGLHGTQY